MRRLLVLALLGLFAFSPGIARAQLSGPMEVDANEVRRRGDMVVHVDPESRADVEPSIQAFMQITELPANDNDKWFIYVVGQKNCPACDRLKQQWQTDATLRAYAVPNEPKASWAHFTWYYLDDRLQAFRWDKTKNPHALDIKATPTIVCQPPRSAKYGDPGTIVYQGVYQGDPQAFAKALNSAIKGYCEYLSRRGDLPEQKAAAGVPSFGEGFQPTPVQNGGLWNVAPEKVALYAVASNEPAVSSGGGPQGFGQQTVPPVDLPNEPKVEPNRPIIDRASQLFNPGMIVVVRDKEALPNDQCDAWVEKSVAQLQPADKTLDVRHIPLDKNPYGVAPDRQLPVVMRVKGKEVVDKLTYDPNEEKGFITLTILALAMWLGYQTASHMFMGLIWAVVKFVFYVAVLAAIVFAVVYAMKPKEAKPAKSPPLTPEQIAALEAAGAARATVPKSPPKPATE